MTIDHTTPHHRVCGTVCGSFNYFCVHRYCLSPCFRKTKGWQVRSCGSGSDSWAARQWQFVSSKHPEKYSSANCFLHCKALGTWLTKTNLMGTLRDHLGSTVFFDDPRISNSVCVHMLHAWGIELQKYKMDETTCMLLFLEGLSFMVPSTSPDYTEPGMQTSGREACLGACCIFKCMCTSVQGKYYRSVNRKMYVCNTLIQVRR